MNREIKFRAYDSFTETMINDWLIQKDGFEFEGFDTTNNRVDIKGIMQYTGLKDKNGVEIYEGDILENKKSGKGNFFVKFNVGGYDAVYKNNFTLCLHPVLHDFEGCQIIGNIYQTPELLK